MIFCFDSEISHERKLKRDLNNRALLSDIDQLIRASRVLEISLAGAKSFIAVEDAGGIAMRLVFRFHHDCRLHFSNNLTNRSPALCGVMRELMVPLPLAM